MIAALVGLLAAAAAGLAIVDRPGRRRAIAMAVAVLLAPALIAGDQWDAAQVSELRSSPGLLAAALVGVGVFAAGGAVLFRRWPVMLPVLVLFVLPFRVPIAAGGEEANLLMPLYLVMAAGVLAALWREFVGNGGDRVPVGTLVGNPAADPGNGSGRDADTDFSLAVPRGVAAWLRPLLAASVLLYAVGLFWSDDQSVGLQNLCFFLVPFAVVFALMTEVGWTVRRLRVIMMAILGLAVVCALIGFVEWGTRSLLWNQAVIRSNDFHVYFRVNSLFWDPNVFGRYLALAITVGAAALLWAKQPRAIGLLAATVFVLWLALLTTYSQSSFIALLAGLAALAALRFNLKVVLGGLAALAVGVLLFGSFAGGLVKLDLGALNKQTSGRANLVEGGIDLFEQRPVAGFGPGAFSAAFKREVAGPNAPVTESHTEPVTVAAEQGVIGLVVYVALIVSALAALLAGVRKVMPGLGAARGSRDPERGPPAARAA
ncbi:MAG: O-antigen ligase family protein, partial [Actinomycetota bacterium]|nr:O-antigen ligase family protein [Actinomycetota bacterium]